MTGSVAIRRRLYKPRFALGLFRVKAATYAQNCNAWAWASNAEAEVTGELAEVQAAREEVRSVAPVDELDMKQTEGGELAVHVRRARVSGARLAELRTGMNND